MNEFALGVLTGVLLTILCIFFARLLRDEAEPRQKPVARRKTPLIYDKVPDPPLGAYRAAPKNPPPRVKHGSVGNPAYRKGRR